MPGAWLTRALRLWGPVAAYVVAIFYLSSLSRLPGWTGTFPDYAAHAAEYAGLAILVARALNGGLLRPVPARRLLLALLLSVACGAADEVWQHFTPHRFSDWTDVTSDALGAALGLSVLRAAQAIAGRLTEGT